MNSFEVTKAYQEWRDQKLALFARRAHRHLGRGFVLSEGDESPPIYVTRLIGAPQQLVSAVLDYNPENEALVVWEDADGESIVVNCVRIEYRH